MLFTTMNSIPEPRIHRFPALANFQAELIAKYDRETLAGAAVAHDSIANIALAIRLNAGHGPYFRVGSATDADYFAFVRLDRVELYEYLLVELDETAYCARNAMHNSNAANMRELMSLVDGGYYQENKEFEELLNDEDVGIILFKPCGGFEILVPVKYPNTGEARDPDPHFVESLYYRWRDIAKDSGFGPSDLALAEELDSALYKYGGAARPDFGEIFGKARGIFGLCTKSVADVAKYIRDFIANGFRIDNLDVERAATEINKG